jgi:hypothetical protein
MFNANLNVFIKNDVFIAIYINNILIFSPSRDDINSIKDSLLARFL